MLYMTEKPTQIALLLPPAMLAAVDQARRGTARIAWIREAIQQRLEGVPSTPQATLEDIFDTEAERIDTTALMEAGRAQEQAMLEGRTTYPVLDVPASHTPPDAALPPHVVYASQPEDGHLHKAEAYGQSYLAGGARWTLRRCTMCGKDLPPKRA